MLSVSTKAVPYYPYGLPNRAAPEPEEDDNHSQVLTYEPEHGEYDAFLSQCFDKNEEPANEIEELSSEAIESLTIKTASSSQQESMMLIMMQEMVEPSCSLSDDRSEHHDDILPTLTMSLSLDDESSPTASSICNENILANMEASSIADEDQTNEQNEETSTEIAPSAVESEDPTITTTPATTPATTAGTPIAPVSSIDDMDLSLSLACKSLDSAMSEYQRFKLHLSAPTITTSSSSTTTPLTITSISRKLPAAATRTQQICQQAQRRAQHTTLLSTSSIAGQKAKLAEAEANRQRLAWKREHPVDYSKPKATKSSRLLLFATSNSNSDSNTNTTSSLVHSLRTQSLDSSNSSISSSSSRLLSSSRSTTPTSIARRNSNQPTSTNTNHGLWKAKSQDEKDSNRSLRDTAKAVWKPLKHIFVSVGASMSSTTSPTDTTKNTMNAVAAAAADDGSEVDSKLTFSSEEKAVSENVSTTAAAAAAVTKTSNQTKQQVKARTRVVPPRIAASAAAAVINNSPSKPCIVKIPLVQALSSSSSSSSSTSSSSMKNKNAVMTGRRLSQPMMSPPLSAPVSVQA